jgi:hypothetical protein
LKKIAIKTIVNIVQQVPIKQYAILWLKLNILDNAGHARPAKKLFIIIGMGK